MRRLIFAFLLPAIITTAADDKPLRHIVFGSCLDKVEHPMLDRALALPMDLFIYMGDNIYADTRDMAVMRAKYSALAGSRFHQGLLARALVLATWDDHDYGVNDGGADYPMRKEAQKEFHDWLGTPAGSPLRAREGVYHSRVFGPAEKSTQVILLDTRYHRTPLKRVPKEQAGIGGSAVPNDDPGATLLGAEQWRWLEAELGKPARLRLVISSIQFAAAASGSESWANFPLEQRRMADLIRATRAQGVLFFSGDRHWCELSTLTGNVPYPLHDLTASSMTQAHPRGTPTPNANRSLPATFHQPNAGALEVDWDAPDPLLTLRIVDQEGATRLEKRLRLGELR
ncbi:MAG TPA: phosphodiesterase [Verrucomicrobiales bacterium]|nr:phosphodiesterase [Verrucomicrobiales bacterium]